MQLSGCKYICNDLIAQIFFKKNLASADNNDRIRISAVGFASHKKDMQVPFFEK